MKMKKGQSSDKKKTDNPKGAKRIIRRKVIEPKNRQIYKGKTLKYNNSFEVKDFEATI